MLLPARPLEQCAARPKQVSRSRQGPDSGLKSCSPAVVLASVDRGCGVPAGCGADRGRAEPADAGVRADLAGRGRRLRQPGARTEAHPKLGQHLLAQASQDVRGCNTEARLKLGQHLLAQASGDLLGFTY